MFRNTGAEVARNQIRLAYEDKRDLYCICKVMSVPDSRCIRVMTLDDHVSIGFHEILIYDLADGF